jgi:hypothetical protein
MHLDSHLLGRLVRGAPWLWIDSPARAAAAAITVLSLFGGAALFEASEPWCRLAAAEPKADAARETRLLATLAWVGASRVETVILLGGSTAQELPPSEARVSALLTERCDRPIRFINGATSSQTMTESWMIADAVPDSRRTLVVVGMNYLRFEEGFAEVARDVRAPLLPLRSRALERTLKEAGHSPAPTMPRLTGTAWFLSRLDQVNFRPEPEPFDVFLARRESATPWHGPLNLYQDPPLDPEKKAAIVRQMIAERLSLFEGRRAEAGALWRAFVRRFDGPGSTVLFLALPEDPSLAPFAAAAGDGFAHEMAGLGGAGARVADWRTDHGLAQSDFHDQQHLLASGRRKLEPRLADLFAEALVGCE